jgi:tetratricopeptide (TPR) repeat protein
MPIPDTAPVAVLPPTEAEIAAARALVAEDPKDSTAWFRLSAVLHAAGRKEECLAAIRKAVEIGPATEGRLMNLAISYADLYRFPEAVATYERLLKEHPGNSKAWNNLGNIAMRRGAFDEAIGHFEKAIAIDPSYLLAYYRMGYMLKRTGRRDEAVAAFRHVIETTPKTPYEQTVRTDTLYQIGSLAMDAGATEQAAEILKEVLEIAPDHPLAHYALGQALIRLGKVDEGQVQLQEHMRLMAGRAPEAPTGTANNPAIGTP